MDEKKITELRESIKNAHQSSALGICSKDITSLCDEVDRLRKLSGDRHQWAQLLALAADVESDKSDKNEVMLSDIRAENAILKTQVETAGGNAAHYADMSLDLERQIEILRRVCAEAYQLAGVVGAPEAALDNLSDAAQGVPFRHETFLPVLDTDCSVIAELTSQRDEAQGKTDSLLFAVNKVCERTRSLTVRAEAAERERDEAKEAKDAYWLRMREALRELRDLASHTGALTENHKRRLDALLVQEPTK